MTTPPPPPDPQAEVRASDPTTGAPDDPGAPGVKPRDPRRRALLAMVGGLLVALIIVAVVLIVARPKEKLVPAVVDSELIAAQSTLEDDGFKVAVKRVVNVASRDRVLAQDPGAGTKADDGSTVTLTVSNGPGQGTVPDVAELPQPRAVTVLREAGFRSKIQQRFSSGVPQGVAIGTQPPAGSRVERLSRVLLVVSRGPQTVAVPEVVGDTEAAAKASIGQAGLQAEVVQERSNQSPGDVLSQAPAAGTTVVLGSVVRVVVDKAPEPVQVPNVIGKPVENAVSSLSNLGLAVFFRNKTVNNPSQNNTVLRQQPNAGTKVEPGTRVILQVARYQPNPPNPPTPPTSPTASTAATTGTGAQTATTSP
jgi:serine/threonine-protein kinase